MREGLCGIWNVGMSSTDVGMSSTDVGMSSTEGIFYTLHTLASIIGEDNALQLPAAHNLTVCDTVSKACYTDSSPKYSPRKFYSCSANRGHDISGRKFSCEYNQGCPKQNKNIQ